MLLCDVGLYVVAGRGTAREEEPEAEAESRRKPSSQTEEKGLCVCPSLTSPSLHSLLLQPPAPSPVDDEYDDENDDDGDDDFEPERSRKSRRKKRRRHGAANATTNASHDDASTTDDCGDEFADLLHEVSETRTSQCSMYT